MRYEMSEMNRVQKCIMPNLQRTKLRVGVKPKIQVAQNVLKHILVLEFLKSDEISEITTISYVATSKQPMLVHTNGQYSNQISRSTLLRDGATENRNELLLCCPKMGLAGYLTCTCSKQIIVTS